MQESSGCAVTRSVNGCESCSIKQLWLNVTKQTTMSWGLRQQKFILPAPYLPPTDIIGIWQYATSAIATLSLSEYKFIIFPFKSHCGCLWLKGSTFCLQYHLRQTIRCAFARAVSANRCCHWPGCCEGGYGQFQKLQTNQPRAWITKLEKAWNLVSGSR